MPPPAKRQKQDNESAETDRHLIRTAMSLRNFGVDVSKVREACKDLIKTSHDEAVAGYIEGCSTVVTDIEGTTTPIPFVASVLFPYALERVEEYVKANYKDLKEVIDGMRVQAEADPEEVPKIPEEAEGVDAVVAGVVENFKYNSKENRKVTAMKSLQGMIWKAGYADGLLKGKVFPDVAPAFQRWTESKNKKLAIYSSGSVPAQKLLFGQSTSGDLLPFISAHFDTTTGHKRDPASYTAIATALDQPPSTILFLTDIVPEATAAIQAGFKSILLNRPENLLLPECDQLPAEGILQAMDFDAIFP
eukprot:TRINITY_DN194_c1_g1_i1.p1 TRINITY_DN194_c1_g1~~TRINITY_DN194_c1_g1_i1.p1  ORF type:complete len:305 (+),score=85.06 TRINITY_DN194_c1_g1_i1:55-969(+)